MISGTGPLPLLPKYCATIEISDSPKFAFQKGKKVQIPIGQPREEITRAAIERCILTGNIWSFDNEDLQRSGPNLKRQSKIDVSFQLSAVLSFSPWLYCSKNTHNACLKL